MFSIQKSNWKQKCNIDIFAFKQNIQYRNSPQFERVVHFSLV